MRRYETIYILRPSVNEEEIDAILTSTNSILAEDNGEIIQQDKWGLKKLAYPIKKEEQGYYIFCDYATHHPAVAEMERKFRIDDTVLKFMTIKLADAITAEDISDIKNDIVAKETAAQEAAESSEESGDAPVEKTTESESTTTTTTTTETATEEA